MGWGTTQSGSSGEGHYPRARERSRQDAVERSDENAEGRSNHTDAGRSSHADTGRSSHTDTGPSSHTETGPSSHKDLELRGRDDLRRSPVAVHSKEESTDWLDAEDQGWTDSGPDEQEQERKNARERERWGAVNSRLLQAMGGGGRWNADSLIEATGLSASEVNTALTYLQLGGRIRRRGDVFEPI